jgi:hypothetical protein
MLVVKSAEPDVPDRMVRMVARRGVRVDGRELKEGDEFEARRSDAAEIEGTGRARVIDEDRGLVYRVVPLW